MMTRSEILIEDIRSLGFQDIRERVILRRLILESLEHILVTFYHSYMQHSLKLHVVKYEPL